ACLIEANLWQADLSGANLTGCQMRGVLLYETHFDEATILPDGSRWSAEVDVNRFIDPAHPNFWSDNGRA
ncbi:MAG: pentapeptide repeat-containing protein, partial [Anaerolineae bacterium]|nr:pentapeptide repeat-containing protein [Anaerolineae bacterium]